MPSSSPSTDRDTSPSDPASPRKASAAARKSNDAGATPPKKVASPGGHDKPARASPKGKEPPTLLADFLKGKQSAARVAADRRRRKSLDAVKAELKQEMKHEMKQNAVRRVQPPGTVKNRVKAWQKANAAVIAGGDPDDAATEPPDVAFKDEDAQSVTEEDRVRIKNRQKRRTTPRKKSASHEKSETEGEGAMPDHVDSKPLPKKRVVSDDNWVKTKNKKTPPRKVSPNTKKPSYPSFFNNSMFRAPPTPLMADKIKAWADKVEIPDTPPPRSFRSSRSAGANDKGSDAGETSSQTTARQMKKSQPFDDGIRVTPVNSNILGDDGIRVTPMGSAVSDDGGAARNKTAQSGSYKSKHARSKSTPTGGLENAVRERLERQDAMSNSSRTSVDREHSSDVIEVVEEPESVLSTPTKRPPTKKFSTGKARPKSHHVKSSEISTWTDDESYVSGMNKSGSDIASSIAAKSLADIPGEIPFGHSAFSELDLPLNGAARSRPKRPKVDRNTSLKGMPNVLKRVMSEGKKIIQDLNEPPRQQVANKPPSIEKWLNNTVDPFLDNSVNGAESSSKTSKPAKDASEVSRSTRKTSQETHSSTPHTNAQTQEGTATNISIDRMEKTPEPEIPKQAKTPTSSNLQRRKATRSATSPVKPTEKRPFFGALKQAFQGESAGHAAPRRSYQSFEPRKDLDEYEDTDGSTPPDSPSLEGLSRTAGQTQEDSADSNTPKMLGPRFRPPTNGHHELSTIMSEEDSSAVGSDMTSDLSQSTLTQSTGLTKDSDFSRKRSQGPGLKRRLTKHSDLVSVLSLPDDNNVPERIKSNRSRPSQRKARGAANDVTVDDLLTEFAEDEHLYQRELKTLVDGVIPVLLSTVVSGSNVSELFGSTGVVRQADMMSKSVVSMGVALEKLKNAHRKAPISDLRRLAHWAHGVVPIYNSYLSAWRMGFQDLVVNLAPAADRLADEDSLIGALPRNDHGDIVNADGERVDVAHLLKRPLLRIKQMVRLIQCMDSMIPSQDTQDLLRDFENLQEKARRRHREETARMTDEDAFNTDTTRARSIRTLEALNGVIIHPDLQVAAKDMFALDLAHSNGQRLECKVELVFRDNQERPELQGDLLIREVGETNKSYLLFSPVPISSLSARTGDGNFDMVVMVRGSHNGRQWHELLNLTADNEDQILDWLDMLPLNPIPPREPEPSVVSDPGDETYGASKRPDAPVGAKNVAGWTRTARYSTPPEAPSTPPHRQYQDRRYSAGWDSPTTPVSNNRPYRDSTPDSQTSQKTPTQNSYGSPPTYQETSPRNTRRESRQSSPNSTPYREDGAPPPPIHRTLSTDTSPEPQSSQNLTPPEDLKKSERIKRRTSSPLKHEYLPSDAESITDASLANMSDYDSSDDEIDSVDIPETEIGVSIPQETTTQQHRKQALDKLESDVADIPHPMPSVLSASECSLTPSNSASQAGLHGHKISPEDNVIRYMASISRWSDKGRWKDVTETACSVIVTAGLIEVFGMRKPDTPAEDERPLLALDLTPLVLIRQSTALDLEIRSTVQTHCTLSEKYQGGNFRFRCFNGPECFNLYMSVHHARLNNQKFIELENEARFKGFGERQRPADNDADSSARRRTWFGRKNSYRSSVRAPHQSQDGASTTPSSNMSASSFLKRLTVAGNMSFNIARSSLDKHSRPGSGGASLYTSGSSSGGGTTPRSPSISVGNSSNHTPVAGGTENIRIRLHLLVTSSKWEDHGNCSLQIRRPPPGWHQALRADHGLEKRITVTTIPKKDGDQVRILLDAVLGSGCFTPMGTRGIVCGVWEDLQEREDGVVQAPATGGTGGNIKKWCFQFASSPEANWVLRLVHQEVLRA